MTYKYNLEDFKSCNSFAYYMLGVFCSDGCASDSNKTLSLSSLDRSWLVAIKNRICPEVTVGKHNNCYRIQFGNKFLYNWFVSRECTPKKSLTLKFPKVPQEYLRDFIRGMFDGDGSIGAYIVKSKWKDKTYPTVRAQAYICSASKRFITKLDSVLTSNNVAGFMVIDKKKAPTKIRGKLIKNNSPVYRLTFAYRRCLKLVDFLYYKGCFCLHRKQKIAKLITKHYT